MPFTATDVVRVLWQIYPDMLISHEVARDLVNMTSEVRNRTFPGELEAHAISEENKYRMEHPDATASELGDIRQEYLVAEILEMAGNAAKDHKRHEIANDSIAIAIRNDPELKEVLQGLYEEIPSIARNLDSVSSIASGMQYQLDILRQDYPSLYGEDTDDTKERLKILIRRAIQRLREEEGYL